MNQKVFKFISLGIGCAAGMAALFNTITGIIKLTLINVNYDALTNTCIVMLAAVALATAVGFGLLAYTLIMAFTKGEVSKFTKYPVAVYGITVALVQLVLMIFGGAYTDARCYVLLVLGASAIVAFAIALLQQDKKTANILTLVAASLAFLASVVCESVNGDLDLACDVFSMFAISGVIGYIICEIVSENMSNNSKKESNKEIEDKKEEE